MADKREISVTLNGNELTNFDYDRDSRLVKANIRLTEGPNTVVVQVKNKDGEVSASTAINYQAATVATVATVKPTPTSEPEKLKEGAIIKIERLQFAPSSSIIDQESYSSLDAVYSLLASNPNMIVEIGGHTNLIIEEGESLILSTNRAKAVANYLIGKGIDKKRLVTKGYGRNFPIENNFTPAANKVNQRVELKILSTNG